MLVDHLLGEGYLLPSDIDLLILHFQPVGTTVACGGSVNFSQLYLSMIDLASSFISCVRIKLKPHSGMSILLNCSIYLSCATWEINLWVSYIALVLPLSFLPLDISTNVEACFGCHTLFVPRTSITSINFYFSGEQLNQQVYVINIESKLVIILVDSPLNNNSIITIIHTFISQNSQIELQLNQFISPWITNSLDH